MQASDFGAGFSRDSASIAPGTLVRSRSDERALSLSNAYRTVFGEYRRVFFETESSISKGGRRSRLQRRVVSASAQEYEPCARFEYKLFNPIRLVGLYDVP